MKTALSRCVLLLALAAAPAAAQRFPQAGDLRVFLTRDDQAAHLHIEVRSAGGAGALILAGTTSDFTSTPLYDLGVVGLDAAGNGALVVPLPIGFSMPTNDQAFFRAYFIERRALRQTPLQTLGTNMVPCERLDFDHAPSQIDTDKEELVPQTLYAGELITSQWAAAGILMSGDNAHPLHPDKTILFDSSDPTGEDEDLATPGTGKFNDTPLGKLLILAEDDEDLDVDGLVDDPDDENHGGVLTFLFDQPVALCEVAIVDLDEAVDAELRCYDGATLLGKMSVPSLGDNSVSRVEFTIAGVTRLEVDLSGSGAIAELAYFSSQAHMNWDETATGIPLDLETGEVVTDQLPDDYGLRVSAVSNGPAGTHAAVLFDTANPTGGDDDLSAPGAGPGNDKPEGRVLVIAETLTDDDMDGLVDDPGDENHGGDLILDFDFEVSAFSARVMDIDAAEDASFIELLDEAGASLGLFPLVPLGDGSAQDVDLGGTSGVHRMVLHLTGSGALSNLQYSPVIEAGPGTL